MIESEGVVEIQVGKMWYIGPMSSLARDLELCILFLRMQIGRQFHTFTYFSCFFAHIAFGLGFVQSVNFEKKTKQIAVNTSVIAK